MFRIIKVDLYRLVPCCLTAADVLRDVSVLHGLPSQGNGDFSLRGTMKNIRPLIDHALFGQGLSWLSGTHSSSCRDPMTGCGRRKAIVNCQARDLLLVHRAEPHSDCDLCPEFLVWDVRLCNVTATYRRQTGPRGSQVGISEGRGDHLSFCYGRWYRISVLAGSSWRC
jgi:hypothetical protein